MGMQPELTHVLEKCVTHMRGRWGVIHIPPQKVNNCARFVQRKERTKILRGGVRSMGVFIDAQKTSNSKQDAQFSKIQLMLNLLCDSQPHSCTTDYVSCHTN